MVKIKKYANGIERFLHGEKGQRFFNFAYSIGAAIVIWGALFKILHLPGGATLLCIGMGTEIAMFILTAFDRPAKEYEWENVFPVLDSKDPEDRPDFAGGGGGGFVGGIPGGMVVGSEVPEGEEGIDSSASPQHSAGGNHGGGFSGGGVIIAGGGPAVIGGQAAEGVEGSEGVVIAGGGPAVIGGGVIGGQGGGLTLTEDDAETLKEAVTKMASASEQLSRMAELTEATSEYLERLSGIAEQMTQLQETTRALNNVSSTLLQSYEAITQRSEEITGSSAGYVDRLSDLNRNISGLNTIYEIQLKSVSSQLDTIDRVNRSMKDIRDMYEKSANESSHYCEETEKMARYMKQLNKVYEKMIHAMTINMHNPMMGANPFDTPSED